MADAMDAIKNILGDGAEDKIKNVMSSFSTQPSSSGEEASAPASAPIDTDGLEQLMQLKNIMESITTNRNDPRTNLLLSLKPYMRGGRQHSIDSAVRLLGLRNVAKLLGK